MQRSLRGGLVAFVVLSSFGLPVVGQQKTPLNKYGPQAVRLYEAREHIQQTKAPDYWALMPYYRAQPNDSACSVAAVAMLMNGLRVRENLPANEPLVTPENLLEKLNDPRWSAAVANDGAGVSLEELGEVVRSALKAFGQRNYRVVVVHVKESSPTELARLRTILNRNEESDRDFLIANFLQSAFTEDPAGSVGHFAPIAAYDAKCSRVLILDPDRAWYEPYWVSDQTLLEGMATRDSQSKRSRGYLWIHPRRDSPRGPLPQDCDSSPPPRSSRGQAPFARESDSS